ncbi:MAG: hypothetical protein R2831_11145 [Chitinophagaceae bacterium]
MQQELLQTIEDLIGLAKKMRARIDSLEKDNENLQESVFKYIALLDQQKEESTLIEQHELAKQLVASSKLEKNKLKKDLDKYIAIINKCIATIEVKL